jgi:perosamine synthetase
MIPVYKPYLPAGSLSRAHDALDSTWLSSQGKYLSLVQEKLQELLGVKYVLPLNNGTSACHLVAQELYRARPPIIGNKRIIVPDNVYVAAWNAFLFDQNYKLIPVSTDLDTWNVDLHKLDDAIMANPDADVLIVHNIGNIINVPILQQKYPNIHFVEDNCEGFLGTYNSRFSGTASFASAISFFGNKTITSGEGGALVTDFEDVYLHAKCVQGQGQSNRRFIHSDLGYNYRMTNIQAAILCTQIDLASEIIQRKQDVFEFYRHAFSSRDDIKVQNIDPSTTHSNWMFGVRVPGQLCYEAAEIFFKLHGIEIRPMFYSIFKHDHLSGHQDIFGVDCTNADLLQKECFILPSFPELTQIELRHIIDTVNEYVIGVNGP